MAPKPTHPDGSLSAIEVHADLILSVHEARPATVLRELRDALAEHGVPTSTSGMAVPQTRRRAGLRWGIRGARRGGSGGMMALRSDLGAPPWTSTTKSASMSPGRRRRSASSIPTVEPHRATVESHPEVIGRHLIDLGHAYARVGLDRMMRAALYEAALVLLTGSRGRCRG